MVETNNYHNKNDLMRFVTGNAPFSSIFDILSGAFAPLQSY